MMPPSVSALVDAAPDPEQAACAWARIAEQRPAGGTSLEEALAAFADKGAALIHLLSVSPVSVDKLAADPAALDWIADPEVHGRERGPGWMRAHYLSMLGDANDMADGFRTLRRWKAQETLRIALREVAGWSSVERTTAELTHVAEICLRQVLEPAHADLVRRLGEPQSAFGILGMGKFGGQELNYSSDIDLIFFYGEDGALPSGLTCHEFFTRLAERVVEAFTNATCGGTLFRVDLRLRPEGQSGPLVRSLDSMEDYYAAFGETWERMALIKARLVAGTRGSDELAYEFGQRLQAFIFPKAVAPEMLDEIAAVKTRIEREVVGESAMYRNVKLGFGGIREIEFVAQTLQILHGARNAFLQERSTLKALGFLRQIGLIPLEDMQALIDAYRFLRTVEHRLQIENEAQTHVLPENPDALHRIARSLGFADTAAFQSALSAHTTRVREIFQKVLRSKDETPAPPPVRLDIFRDPENAQRLLHELAEGRTGAVAASPRTRQLYRKLEPLLVQWLGRIADPDAVLIRLVRFVERYGSRGGFYETLLQNPRVLEMFVKLFDASAFMSEIVIRRPQLIEEVARSGGLGETCTVTDYLRGLDENEESLPWHDWVRVYRRAQLLRIGLRDILQFAELPDLQSEYSSLAEACLVYCQHQLQLDGELTIAAMGKFGAQELGYGADLDVIIIGRNNSAAADLIRAMSETTKEGRVFPVDARLRPEGNNGPLACPLPTFIEYYEKGRAQLWEAQSLTKSRVISGPEQGEFTAAIRNAWRQFGTRPDLFSEIAAMHERIVRDRAGAADALDFKTGTGGIMQVEFFAQAHQMRADVWEPNTTRALHALAENGAIPADTASELTNHYRFLRRVESVLRRLEDTGASRLPQDETELRQTALRCGFKSTEDFQARLDAARQSIRTLASLQ